MSALIDWVRQTAIALPPPPEWGDLPAARLAALDRIVHGRDAVFLGELDHFVHEKADFRLLLVRYLADRGFRRLAEELSWSDGLRIDRYLATDDESEFDRIATFGHYGELRQDRNDRMQGVLGASSQSYPVGLFRAEQERFYRGLRRLAQPIRLRGFDVDGLPGGAYADVDGALGADPSPAVEAWRRKVARAPGETVAEEAVRLRRGLGDLDDLDLPDDVRTAVRLSLTGLAETLDYVDLAYDQPDYAALSPGMAYREQILKRQALAAFETGGRAPTVFMAHALHLLKDDRLGGGAGPAGPGGSRVSSLGHFLASETGLNVASIWMIWGAGSDSQPFPDLPRTFSYGKDTLNAGLASFMEPLIFPIDGAPAGLFQRPWKVGHMYNMTAEVILAGQVDAICWLPQVSPMRMG